MDPDEDISWSEKQAERHTETEIDPNAVVRTALCIEPRDGRIYVFMPPTETLEDYLDLVWAVEKTACELQMPVVVEGYLPPKDHRVQMIKVTPDRA